MKYILGAMSIFALMMVLSSNKVKEQNDYSLAHVGELDGNYIFFHSIPYHDYDTVFKYTTLVATNNPQKVQSAMKKAFKIANEKGVEFDVIITIQGNTITL